MSRRSDSDQALHRPFRVAGGFARHDQKYPTEIGTPTTESLSHPTSSDSPAEMMRLARVKKRPIASSIVINKFQSSEVQVEETPLV